MTALEILAAGPLTLVQDRGRPGLAHLGVSESGAADRRSHDLANRLVANPADRATLEITMGGLIARVLGRGIDVALTGADALPRADGVPFGINSVHRLNPGQILSLGTPGTGLRSYLAVRGGIAASQALGSRSYDTLSQIGPAPVRAGDVIEIGSPSAVFPEIDLAPVPPIAADPLQLNVIRGPRDDWFDDPDTIVRTAWVVSGYSDRVGVRLTGSGLSHRWPGRQLPSEGTVRGAIQVPPGGQPVILGPDHPATGGYPVIGVVADADTDVLAQARPGQRLLLRWRPAGYPATARRTW